MKKILLFISCFAALMVFAAYQYPAANTAAKTNHFIAKAHFDKVEVGQKNSDKAIENYAYQLMPNKKSAQLTLELQEVKEGSTGYHYYYQPHFNGIPVFRSYVQVNVNWGGEIWSATEMTFDFDRIQKSKLQLTKPFSELKQLPGKFLQKKNFEMESELQTVVYFNTEAKAVIGLHFKGINEKTHEFVEYVLDLEGNVLHEQDQNKHYHAPKSETKKAATIETATAYVFMPDPVTSAQAVYGLNGGFRDRIDADSPEINDERKEVTIEVTFDNGVYRLENEAFSFGELDPRVVPPVTTTQPIFDFTREQDGFEDVNAYYHLNAYRNHLLSLENVESECGLVVDLNPVKSLLIEVDTHSFENADGTFDDQSMFQYGNTRSKLLFGEGGVDDAEDADVIVHEYGHAITHAYCSGCNYGYERLALDESIGDYFAVSYSRSISEYNWQNMFSWDGHNEFFAGRNADTNKLYPDDMNHLAEQPQNEVNESFIYPDSEIFTSVTMEIWEVLGREDMDKLILASLPTFTGDIKFSTAAELLSATYAQLCGDNKTDAINTLLSLRGLLDFSLSAGPDQTICLGDTITLGENLVVSDGLEVFWSPGESFEDSLEITAMAMPDFSGYYYLNIRNMETGFLLQDSLFVQVDYCFAAGPDKRIVLLNTDRFFNKRGNLIVEVPKDTENSTIEVFDVFGHLMGEYVAEGDTRIELAQDDLKAGIYLVRVKADDREAVFKVGRAR
ncbi:MAG: T9SS type A sorting domain-containing protein [Chitinophagales bacterium]